MTSFFSFVHAPECAYCSIGKLVNCEFSSLSYFSALYTLRYVLIVKVILVILIQKKTKKKNKKNKKNDPYFGMGKNIKVIPQYALLSIFSLGKGREYLHLKPYEKLSAKCAF